MGLATWLVTCSVVGRTRAENRVDYRFEDYAEEGGRVHIQTHGAYLETGVSPWLSLKASFVYDAISGATPLGAPPIPGTSEVAKVSLEDIRRAGLIEPAFKIGNHTLSPQVSYSAESDYESTGLAFTHRSEWNDKNTSLSWGISHSFDRVLPNEGATIAEVRTKDTTDALLGITQLLGPNTTLTLNLTLGYSQGYLADPYKRVLFDDFPYIPGEPYTVFPELRPDHRFRQVAYAGINHYVEALRGAVDANYRFHHDDWGIWAHTFGLEWHQKIGRAVTLSPLFRFHSQSAADFYGTRFPGDPSCPPGEDPSCPQVPLPDYYSADYRLSALQTFTYGATLEAKIHKHVSLEFAYKRYDMRGTDGVTAQDQYPQANVFGGGVTIWF